MSISERTDETLMVAVQDGDRAAYDELFRRWRDPVYRYLHRRCGSQERADDAFQECWLRVHRFRHRYDPGRTFRPWLFTIAANAGYDARRPRPDEHELDERLPAPRPDLTSRDLAVRALAALEPDDRKLLLLVVEGFSAVEIAEMLETRPGTVRMRIKRARERAAAALEPA
ncbi:MAG: RNA polymerase sigma factor [Alphaproteobacteria bacterium]|nr:RNA polymerase sigma factor [Alphaproteobacteria bacterium]